MNDIAPTQPTSSSPSSMRPLGRIDLVRLAPVTSGLIALNVLIAIAMGISGVNIFTPSTADMLKWGASMGITTLDGERWRMLTAAFLHYGLLHLGFNMWALWCGGTLLERMIGSPAFLITYLMTGLLASAASLIHQQTSVSAGASGAIFGLFGCIASYLAVNRSAFPALARGHLTCWIWRIILPNLMLGFALPMIDNAAHLGGFAGGLAAGAILGVGNHLKARMVPRAVGFSLLGGGVLAGVLFYMGNPNQDFETGVRLYHNKDFAAAEQIFQSLSKRIPRVSQVWSIQASIAEQQGHEADALKYYERALKTDADDAASELEYAFALARFGKLDSARPMVDQAIQSEPRDTEILFQRALFALRFEKDDKAALSWCDRAIALDPTDASSLALRGLIETRLGLDDVARRDTALLTQNEVGYLALYDIGKQALDERDRALAQEALELGRTLFPDESMFPFELGFVYYALDQDQQAAINWRAAAAIESHPAGTLENIGLIRLRAGDWAGALAVADEVDALEPNLTWTALFRAIAADRLSQRSAAEAAYKRWNAQKTPADIWELSRLLPEEFHPYLQAWPLASNP